MLQARKADEEMMAAMLASNPKPPKRVSETGDGSDWHHAVEKNQAEETAAGEPIPAAVSGPEAQDGPGDEAGNAPGDALGAFGNQATSCPLRHPNFCPLYQKQRSAIPHNFLTRQFLDANHAFQVQSLRT